MDFFDFIFPQKCVSCKKNGKYVCEKCVLKIKKGKVLYKKGEFEKVFILFEHNSVVRDLILKLKYKYISDLSDEIGSLCIQEINNLNLKNENFVIIPIPLHKIKLKKRGFNQSEIIAKKISKKLNWELNTKLLIRNKNTKQQALLSKIQREKNIQNAFAINLNFNNFKNKKFLLFDDVWTTGSTMNEAAKELKKAGVNKIYGMTIAGRL